MEMEVDVVVVGEEGSIFWFGGRGDGGRIFFGDMVLLVLLLLVRGGFWRLGIKTVDGDMEVDICLPYAYFIIVTDTGLTTFYVLRSMLVT